jgi:ribulose-phosphate 3-epimerase
MASDTIFLPSYAGKLSFPYATGGTESIRACLFDAATGSVIGKACAVPYKTYHPHPGWAEQDPETWYENMALAVRGAIDSVSSGEDDGANQHEISALCVDTTCCSVVALDSNYKPLRRCLLWMDARSAPQTKKILDLCKGDPALEVNCGGEGPLSAEWMVPKALWIKENEPEVWERAETICEYQDYINYRLTGVMCASSCNAASRWHWDGEDATVEPSDENLYPGRPLSLYERLDMPELTRKLPQRCIPMGSILGRLTPEAAAKLNLPENLPVAQGGPDAFVGMIGLGCIHPGQLCLITGSSHLHCVVSSKPKRSPGIWGAYRGAPLPGINFAEGGQSSTGSIVRWAKAIFNLNEIPYAQLDAEAANISPGCEGLMCLETFQGSRTPRTDPRQRGAFLGLTLAHSRAHIWRAILEGVCFGTRGCIEGLSKAGHACEEIIIAGGSTRSQLWLQMHADVTGKHVVVCENPDAPLLGCAVLASVAIGLHQSVEDAVTSMVRQVKRIEPSSSSLIYDELYHKVYKNIASSLQSITNAIADIQANQFKPTKPDPNVSKKSIRGGALPDQDKDSIGRIISPSLLACDWANMNSEVERCLKNGVDRLHVDIFDGVFIDSPHALTFGPPMVAAMRRGSKTAHFDCHMCVERPKRYVGPMAEAGANSFIFQWEALADTEDQLSEAMALAKAIASHDMIPGISVNPSTDIDSITPLLEAGVIRLVDVLAVEAGFGGQVFQPVAIEKIRQLRALRKNLPSSCAFEIMVDGGINGDTARLIEADILVAGSFLFEHPAGFEAGLKALQEALA